MEQSQVYCELHRRLGEDRWLVELVRPPRTDLTLESIGITLSLAAIYESLDLLPD